jgi:phosphoribosylglycinamide formyltransferase 1
MADPCQLVILLSGTGSNLQAFIDAIARAELPARIAGVISNRADAGGLARAAAAGIATAVLEHKTFSDRAAFDAALLERVQSFAPDLVLLAGFMRILTPVFVHPLTGRLLNIHPSLLPLYPGLNTHQRALDAGDAQAGATVHFVTEQLDGGPAIIQAQVPIQPGDDAAALAQRVLQVEHRIYPQAANWFAQGRLQLRGERAFLDGAALPATGYVYGEGSPC